MITPKTKPFAFPFPVADTDSGPVVQWKDHSLHLQFTDYLTNQCEVIFDDVSHFEFLVEDELDPSVYDYDGVVEMIDSPVIARLIEIGDISSQDAKNFHHIIIGFNEIGSYLVVIFRNLKPIKMQNKSQ